MSVSAVPVDQSLCVTGRHARPAGLKTVNWYRSGLAKAADRVRKHVDQREIRKRRTSKDCVRQVLPASVQAGGASVVTTRVSVKGPQ